MVEKGVQGLGNMLVVHLHWGLGSRVGDVGNRRS